MTRGASAYGTTGVLTADPYKLILMLYDVCIKNLHLVNQGIDEDNIVKRSEALYKVIEIINELLIAVRGETEQAAFLRGLYIAILLELPKVNLTNDKAIIDRSIRYIIELRRMWQEVIADENKKNNCSREELHSNTGGAPPRQINYSNSAATYQRPQAL